MSTLEFSKLNGYTVKDAQSRSNITQLKGNYIVDNIVYEKKHYTDTNTDYYVVTVPHTDSKGNLIRLKRGFANDNLTNIQATETTRSFARRKNATFCTNAGVFDNVPSSQTYKNIKGLIINDGVVLCDDRIQDTRYQILGIKDDNTLVAYPNNVTSEVVLADGCNNTISAFQCLVNNGVTQELLITDQLYQWSLIGQNSTTKDIFFIACDGKGATINQGMYLSTLVDILVNDYNCDFVYQLDGGGSTSVIFKDEIINQPSDTNITERNVPDYIYFSNDIEDDKEKELADINDRLSDLLFNDKLSGEYLKTVKWITGDTELQLDDINDSGVVFVSPSGTHAPYSDHDGVVYTIIRQSESALQIAFSFKNRTQGSPLDIRTRRRILGVWSDWIKTDTGWSTITHAKGNISYRIKDNVLYLSGLFSGLTEMITINLPVTLNRSGASLCVGGGTNYTKCVMDATGDFKIFPGTGDSTTEYFVRCSFPID